MGQVPKVIQEAVLREIPVSQVQTHERIVEVPQVQMIERTVEVPQIQYQEVVRQVPRVMQQAVLNEVPVLQVQTGALAPRAIEAVVPASSVAPSAIPSNTTSSRP